MRVVSAVVVDVRGWRWNGGGGGHGAIIIIVITGSIVAWWEVVEVVAMAIVAIMRACVCAVVGGGRWWWWTQWLSSSWVHAEVSGGGCRLLITKNVEYQLVNVVYCLYDSANYQKYRVMVS